jgi:hypothetical protein
VADLETGEDLVVGNKLEVTELGTNQKAFNPTQFTDLVQGQIFKATGDFSGKQGSESSHQYANAETSDRVDDVGLASFPLGVTRQLAEKLFQPWYEQNGGSYDPMYGGGLIAVPWKDANPELNFGRVQKQDLEPADMIKLIELACNSGAVQDPVEMRKLFEDAGLGLTKEFTDMIQNQYNPQGNIYPPDFNTYPADQAPRSMDDPNYTSSQLYSPQPTSPGLNFTSPNQGANQTSGKLPDRLDIDDVNALLAATGDTSSETITKPSMMRTKIEEEELKGQKLKNKTMETILKKMNELESEE